VVWGSLSVYDGQRGAGNLTTDIGCMRSLDGCIGDCATSSVCVGSEIEKRTDSNSARFGGGAMLGKDIICGELSGSVPLVNECINKLKGTRGVTYDKRRQSWRAFWTDVRTEREVWHYFPVKHFGFEGARLQAAICRQEAEQRGDAKLPTPGSSRTALRQSGVEGVAWNEKSKAWFARWWENNRRRTKFFRVATYGEEGARREAIQHLINMQGGYTGTGSDTQCLLL